MEFLQRIHIVPRFVISVTFAWFMGAFAWGCATLIYCGRLIYNPAIPTAFAIFFGAYFVYLTIWGKPLEGSITTEGGIKGDHKPEQ